MQFSFHFVRSCFDRFDREKIKNHRFNPIFPLFHIFPSWNFQRPRLKISLIVRTGRDRPFSPVNCIFPDWFNERLNFIGISMHLSSVLNVAITRSKDRRQRGKEILRRLPLRVSRPRGNHPVRDKFARIHRPHPEKITDFLRSPKGDGKLFSLLTRVGHALEGSIPKEISSIDRMGHGEPCRAIHSVSFRNCPLAFHRKESLSLLDSTLFLLLPHHFSHSSSTPCFAL